MKKYSSKTKDTIWEQRSRMKSQYIRKSIKSIYKVQLLLKKHLVNKAMRRRSIPGTSLIYKYIKSDVWKEDPLFWIEPISGSMGQLCEIQIRMSPRVTENDFQRFSQGLYENSGGALIAISNAEAFANGVIIIIVNLHVEEYSQETVIDALKQMRKELQVKKGR